jgi:hypothetical protein
MLLAVAGDAAGVALLADSGLSTALPVEDGEPGAGAAVVVVDVRAAEAVCPSVVVSVAASSVGTRLVSGGASASSISWYSEGTTMAATSCMIAAPARMLPRTMRALSLIK